MTTASQPSLQFGHEALMIIATAVLVLTGIVVLLSIIMLGHHMVTDRQRRQNRERFQSAAVILAPHLAGNDDQLEEAVELARRKNGDRAVALVLRRSRYDLRGPVTERVSRVLVHIGEVDMLVKEAKSRRDWRRAIAIRGLGECGGPEARSVLIDASRDVSGEVRRAAREGLLSDGSSEAIRVAIESFVADLPRRAGWRRSFYARLAVVAANELTSLIRSGTMAPLEEKLALEALGDAGRQSALPLAVERLSHAEGETRATAVRVLGKVGSEREIGLVLEALRDSEWYVRAAAARALELMLTLNGGVRRGSSQQIAFDRLGERLADPAWWVRANAARALSRGGEGGIGVLLRVLDQPDRYARDAAVAALAMAPLQGDMRLTIKRKLDSIIESTGPEPHPAVAQPQPGGLFG